MRDRRHKRKNSVHTPNPSKIIDDAPRNEQNSAANPCDSTVSSSGEPHQPESAKCCNKAKGEKKHWLEYATGGFAFVAAIGELTAAGFSGYQGWVARDAEKTQLRAYVALTNAALKCPRCDNPESLTAPNILPKTPPTHAIPVFPGAYVALRFENSGETPGYDVDQDTTINSFRKARFLISLSHPILTSLRDETLPRRYTPS